MSVFNLVVPRNPHAGRLLDTLGMNGQTKGQYPVDRIRQVWTNDDGTKIFILMRIGQKYSSGFDRLYSALRAHPCYVRDGEEPQDKTYVTFEFNTPEEYIEETALIADHTDTTNPMEAYLKKIKNPDLMVSDEYLGIGKKLATAISKAKRYIDEGINWNLDKEEMEGFFVGNEHGDGVVLLCLCDEESNPVAMAMVDVDFAGVINPSGDGATAPGKDGKPVKIAPLVVHSMLQGFYSDPAPLPGTEHNERFKV